LKDLGDDVILELKARLAGDQVAMRHIYKSFGIKDHFHLLMNIFELFPDTPVKLFKDVLEALQLYDLVDLLEQPQPVRSLRPALPLQEIEKLRKTTDPHPTTYHSNVAVLIITDEKSHHSKEIERFFKGFSSKSDVAVLKWKALARHVEFELRLSRWKRLDEATVRRLERKTQEMETNVITVLERWIHNQGW